MSQTREEAASAPKSNDDLICGLDILKVARNINLICGGLLVACCAFNLLNLFK